MYSLGAILYHLVTGRPPFVAESIHETLLQVLENEPGSWPEWGAGRDCAATALWLLGTAGGSLAPAPEDRALTERCLAGDVL